MELEKSFYKHLAQTTGSPMLLKFSKANGIYLYDDKDEKYLDFISGIAVANIGHSHPVVISAVKEQIDKHMHLMVYGEYIQKIQVTYAESITNELDAELQTVYWVNSGTEATEGAFKLARRVTGRSEIISFKGSYHGSTIGALSSMGNEKYKRAFRPLVPDHRQLEYNDIESLNEISSKTAAVIVECIQAGTGYKKADKVFLDKLSSKCSEVGAMLIIDECQTAFGRTGNLFAHQEYGITPDILCLGKALGGGMPLGAFISSKSKMMKLKSDPILGHITTFGGNPVSCAAGLAAFQVLKSSNWLIDVKRRGELIKEVLTSHPKVCEVRGTGLLLSVILETEDFKNLVYKKLIERKIITNFFLFNNEALRITPPLCITANEIDYFNSNFIQVLNQL
tara:strand:- start:13157 stop:14341 length:1185 start_codon:yes stop_codon:yes gene_type:complete